MYSHAVCCILVLLWTQVFSIELPFDKTDLECLEKTKLKQEDIKDLIDENFHFSVKNVDVKEFLECNLEAKGVFTKDRKINRHVMFHDIINLLFPLMNKQGNLEEIANKILDECINTTDDDLVNFVVKMHNCLVDAANKY